MITFTYLLLYLQGPSHFYSSFHFYDPGLKGPPQSLKFGWSYSNQTWTVSSSKGSSHFTEITCPWGWGGVKM